MAHVIHLNDYALTNSDGGFFARMRQAFADYREYVAILDELNAHSDRELADIGLTRLNVRDVARKAVYGN